MRFGSQATPPRNSQKVQVLEEKLEERGALNSSKCGGREEPSFSVLYPLESQVSSGLEGESGSQSIGGVERVKFQRGSEAEVRLYSLFLLVLGPICGIGDPWPVKFEN